MAKRKRKTKKRKVRSVRKALDSKRTVTVIYFNAAKRRARIKRMRSLGYRYVKSGGLKGGGRFVRLKKLTKRQIAARRKERAAVAKRFRSHVLI